MELLSKKEILERLSKEGATGTMLEQICESKYITFYENTCPDFMIDLGYCAGYMGVTIVKCKEGFLSLPVESYSYCDGYEYFDLDGAELVDKETVQQGKRGFPFLNEL